MSGRPPVRFWHWVSGRGARGTPGLVELAVPLYAENKVAIYTFAQ